MVSPALIILLGFALFQKAIASGVALHPPGYLSACLLARDGNEDVRDWVEYHLWAGVDKIFLFDHNSTVPLINEIGDYVVDGKVQYLYFTSDINRLQKGANFGEGLQGRVMHECMSNARGLFKWMIMTDMDEFLIVTDPKYNNSIPAVLREYETHGAVMVHWVRVGSGGLQERASNQSLLDTFTKCIMPPDEHVKAIAHLDHARVGNNAHMFGYQNGKRGVRVGDKRPAFGHRVPDPLYKPLALYHYSKSIKEYTERSERLRAGVSGMTSKSTDMYRMLDDMATSDCKMGQAAWKHMDRRPKPTALPEILQRRLGP